MMGFLKRLRRNERGNTLILTAAAMPLLLGSAGLATDTIQWALWKRQLQKAADSAAIAGVYAKMAGQDVSTAVNYDLGYGTGTSGGPQSNRTGYALLNAPEINAAPTTGVPAGSTGAVMVTLQMKQVLPFSSMFSTTPTITASATAAGVGAGDYCVVSLESTSTTGISAGGSTKVDLGCGMITNSTSLNAAIAFGSSSVRATPIGAVGGLNTSSNWAPGTTLLPFTLAQPDPFLTLPDPVIPSPCNGKITDKPGVTTTYPSDDVAVPTTQCVTQFDVQGNMTLRPGTYYVTSDFNVGSQAKLSCSGCTFILTNSNANSIPQIKINGGATVNLSAPDSGTYNSVLFYQDRRATNSNGNNINGNSSSTYEGAFYFPSQEVQYTGNTGVKFNCVRLVARRVVFSGNSELGNTCTKYNYDNFQGRHVRLVA